MLANEKKKIEKKKPYWKMLANEKKKLRKKNLTGKCYPLYYQRSFIINVLSIIKFV
jgi:hypothetical protein